MVAALDALAQRLGTGAQVSSATGSVCEWCDLNAEGRSWVVVARGLLPLPAVATGGGDGAGCRSDGGGAGSSSASDGESWAWEPRITVHDLWALRPTERRRFIAIGTTAGTRDNNSSGANSDGRSSGTVECVEKRWSQCYGTSDYAYGGLVNAARPAQTHPLVPSLLALASALAPHAAPYDVALANW
jgi:hypothetical protein